MKQPAETHAMHAHADKHAEHDKHAGHSIAMFHLDDPERRERAERISLRIVGGCFKLLCQVEFANPTNSNKLRPNTVDAGGSLADCGSHGEGDHAI